MVKESEGIRQRKRSPPSPTEEEGQREPLAKHLKRQQTAANQGYCYLCSLCANIAKEAVSLLLSIE